ncbi:MAG: M1 family metallopeptidase, partial [Chloroflexi bacterium]|nr:M1 family metallopeptidase [Chloroflexota bacterium]
MKKFLLLTFIALLSITSCLPADPQTDSPLEALLPTTPPADLSQFKNGLAEEYHPILDELTHASIYVINYVIADDLSHVDSRQTVTYTNTENIALNEVNFRLFSNLFSGEMTVKNLTVNGNAVNPSYSLNNSLLIVPLASPLQPGETASIRMDFKITVPTSVDLNYGVQAYYNDVLALGHAYPMIPVYDDEEWNVEIPSQSGDVIYADMSFFIVTVDAPKEVTLVGSGVEVSRQDNGNRQQVRFEAGPVRDFYLAASPQFNVYVKESNGVTLRFFTKEEYRKGAELALEKAADAIEVFNERYATYPYTELDFVSTPTMALGIEYPGVIAITEWIMDPQVDYLEATTVHEVAHQWFYNLVGNDQLDDPWLDESLAQFATLQYYSDLYGELGMQLYRRDIKGRWAYVGNKEMPVGLPVSAYTNVEYSGIVYGRGALFFIALRDEMGQES